MDIRTELRTYVLQRILPLEDPGALGDDDDLIGSGVLDSLTLVQLANHLEEAYGIRVEAEDIDENNFGSLAALAHYVAGRRRTADVRAAPCGANRQAWVPPDIHQSLPAEP
jgi:acyl carrier protein